MSSTIPLGLGEAEELYARTPRLPASRPPWGRYTLNLISPLSLGIRHWSVSLPPARKF